MAQAAAPTASGHAYDVTDHTYDVVIVGAGGADNHHVIGVVGDIIGMPAGGGCGGLGHGKPPGIRSGGDQTPNASFKIAKMEPRPTTTVKKVLSSRRTILVPSSGT